MSKIIRRTVKKQGAALIVALQLTALTLLSLVSFVGGPQQQSPKAPAELGVSAAPSQTQTDQAQTETTQALTAADKAYLRQSAVYANKVSGSRATQIFNLATGRAVAAAQAR